MAALRQDPYVFADHVTVTTENGVVRLEGVMTDLHDMLRVLRLARRIAGSGRVVNKIELAPSDDDAD
jgi:osmotically-inducible protein OsmY